MNTKNPTPEDAGPGWQPGRADPADPADLAGLKATDAVLGRLSRGDATPQDRQDPLVEALARLRTSLDDPFEQEAGEEISRLMEVLGERPLYLVDDVARATPQDQPIWLGGDEPADRVHVVDLTDPTLDGWAGEPGDGSDHGSGGVSGGGAAQPAAVIALPRQRPGWQRVLEHAALPAASVALLVALGSGVSAVLTGSPMAPVNGVGKVVSQLPGVADQRSTGTTVTSAEQAIRLAGEAAQKHQRQQAVTYLAIAQKRVQQLPPGDQQRLKGQIAEVNRALTAKTPPPLPTGQDPGVVVKPTTPPKSPAPTTSPAPTGTATTTTTTTTSPAPTQSAATSPTASAATSTAGTP